MRPLWRAVSAVVAFAAAIGPRDFYAGVADETRGRYRRVAAGMAGMAIAGAAAVGWAVGGPATAGWAAAGAVAGVLLTACAATVLVPLAILALFLGGLLTGRLRLPAKPGSRPRGGGGEPSPKKEPGA
jgi:hypothetical protein